MEKISFSHFIRASKGSFRISKTKFKIQIKILEQSQAMSMVPREIFSND